MAISALLPTNTSKRQIITTLEIIETVKMDSGATHCAICNPAAPALCPPCLTGKAPPDSEVQAQLLRERQFTIPDSLPTIYYEPQTATGSAVAKDDSPRQAEKGSPRRISATISEADNAAALKLIVELEDEIKDLKVEFERLRESFKQLARPATESLQTSSPALFRGPQVRIVVPSQRLAVPADWIVPPTDPVPWDISSAVEFRFHAMFAKQVDIPERTGKTPENIDLQSKAVPALDTKKAPVLPPSNSGTSRASSALSNSSPQSNTAMSNTSTESPVAKPTGGPGKQVITLGTSGTPGPPGSKAGTNQSDTPATGSALNIQASQPAGPPVVRQTRTSQLRRQQSSAQHLR